MNWTRIATALAVAIAIIVGGYLLLAPRPAGMTEPSGSGEPPPSVNEYGAPSR